MRGAPGPVGPGRVTALLGGLRVAPSGGVGCENRVSCGASEAPADEVTQIEPDGAAGEPGVVLLGAAVAECEASPRTAGDLGDQSFHVGPDFAVLLAQFGVLGPLTTGGAQQIVAAMESDLAAGLRRGAPLTQRAPATASSMSGRRSSRTCSDHRR
jgi:hypothetical protein